MATRIQLRRSSAADWATVNPTLAEGEVGLELDTNKFKFGDGTTSWNDLEYASTISLGMYQGPTANVDLSDHEYHAVPVNKTGGPGQRFWDPNGDFDGIDALIAPRTGLYVCTFTLSLQITGASGGTPNLNAVVENDDFAQAIPGPTLSEKRTTFGDWPNGQHTRTISGLQYAESGDHIRAYVQSQLNATDLHLISGATSVLYAFLGSVSAPPT